MGWVAPKYAPKIIRPNNVTTSIWQAGAFSTDHGSQFTSETSIGQLLDKDTRMVGQHLLCKFAEEALVLYIAKQVCKRCVLRC